MMIPHFTMNYHAYGKKMVFFSKNLGLRDEEKEDPSCIFNTSTVANNLLIPVPRNSGGISGLLGHHT